MKFNKVFILSFILLAILIIGAANAAENTTDGLQQTDSNEVSIDDDMEIPTGTPQDDDYLANETSTLSNEVNQSEIASEINITFEKQMWRYNLSDVKVIESHEINTYDVLNYKNIVMTEEAVKMLEEELK